jgi:hypothetical protein
LNIINIKNKNKNKNKNKISKLAMIIATITEVAKVTTSGYERSVY